MSIAPPLRSESISPPPAPCGAGHWPGSLVELVDHEALSYRDWGTPEGDFLAEALEHLAQLIRWTGADTPDDHRDRMEIWEAEIREGEYRRGFSEGLTRAGLAAELVDLVETRGLAEARVVLKHAQAQARHRSHR